jgi:acyl-CoA synthetase (AMP-forming)/AMP-acid ligase II
VNPTLPNNLGDLLPESIDRACEVLVDLRVPDRPRHLSAGELRDATRAFARGLRDIGIAPGERVAFLSANRWELLVGYLGSMLLGAVAVPVNHKLPPATVAHVIADSGAAVVFFDAERAHLVPPDRQALGFDERGGELFRAFLRPGRIAAFNPPKHHLAEILYTSGSTGAPKGVPLTHAGQLWALGEYLEPGDPAFADSTVVVAPMYHMNALFFASLSLLNGLRMVLMPAFDARRYLEAVTAYHCTTLSGVPTMFALMAALPPEERPAGLDSVRTISLGSAPLSDTLLAQVRGLFPNAEISNGYGSTEAGPAVFGPHPDGLPRPPLSIGYPRPGVDWRLVDGAGPEQGRLQLRTPALADGYLNRPEATEEKFVDGWFDTGDILRRDADGFMYFVGRADDMFVCGGENVYPAQVESLLGKHSAVRDAIVVGTPDDLKGAVPVAFVVLERQAAVSEAELRDHCLAGGPAYAHPRRIVFKSELPVGGTHKIDRRTLAEEAAALMAAEGRATPSAVTTVADQPGAEA